MPRLVMLTLALGAQETNGMISMLSGYVESIQGPQLPIRNHLFGVARLHVDEAEMGEPIVLVTRVEHADGEQVARVEVSIVAQVGPDASPDLPHSVNLVFPLDLEFRREGLYRLTLTGAGEVLGEAPLRVTAQFPTM
ncbi:MAG: hypothetical protein M3137_19045 [Actinomycetota bacterium]|nr:hypothetical protein [Actinomycetota bacterium]